VKDFLGEAFAAVWVVGEAQREGDDGEGRRVGASGGEHRAPRDVEVGDAVHLAVGVDDTA